ncbi:MAG TPA: hypothetical protein VM871_06660 [Flavisolibacter sp.]|nr:hypothetical protein [Flavisolibacter sp.]
MWHLKLLLFCLLCSAVCSAQDDGFSSQPKKRAQYGWVLYASGGAGYYMSNSGVPRYVNPSVSNLGHVASLRIMWHPDHLLKVGVETGNMTFYSYTFKDSVGVEGKMKLQAIPVLVEWTMAVTKRLNLFAGSGVYLLRTNLDYRGKTVSPKVSSGWMAAASYIFPLGKNVGLGTEVKWMDTAEANDGMIALQAQLVWRFLNW